MCFRSFIYIFLTLNLTAMSFLSHFVFLFIILGFLSSCQLNKKQAITYPDARVSDQIDTYFDTTIKDPYRWLEDENSQETHTWIKAQNQLTRSYLDSVAVLPALKERLRALRDYERLYEPVKHGDYYYFYKNDGLQNQNVLYRTPQIDSLATAKVFLDPNSYSQDGSTSVAVHFSKDGSLAVLLIAQGGTDIKMAQVMETNTQTLLGDSLQNIKFSAIAWRGNEGFYYSSYAIADESTKLSAANNHHKIFFHKLNTAQKIDDLIYGQQDTVRYAGATLSEDERYLFISTAQSTTGSTLYFQDLQSPDSTLQPLVANFDHEHSILDVTNTHFLILTNLNAPNRRVVQAPIANPTPENWEDIIPENEHVLTATTGGGKLFAHYLVHATSRIHHFDYDGSNQTAVELPGIGTATVSNSLRSDPTVYIHFSSFTQPHSLLSYNLAQQSCTNFFTPQVPFNPADYQTKQVFYFSKDSTEIPMFIVHKRNVITPEEDNDSKENSNTAQPTLLYGYGGFNISLTPRFSSNILAWLERGGIFAQPNLRGGGEYGDNWHNQGITTQKQNVFDDFIAAAEYLIAQGYTNTDQLAVYGRSNGGLLVGAVLTQRPDLFAVAIPQVGVLDMLRYHTFTAGAGWAYDYGTSEQSKEMFDYLLGYSPVHNVQATAYPATLILTADHDDRVVPAHSYKFAATLQANQEGSAPTLIRIDSNAGHGAGKSTEKAIDEAADMQAFIWNTFRRPN